MQEKMIVRDVATDVMQPNTFQYRRTFPADKMRELADSVKELGFLAPVILRPVTSLINPAIQYEIVAGERRWRTAIALGIKFIPAVIRKLTDTQALTIALAENVQREDPDDWATAEGIKQLMTLSAKEGKPLSEQAVAKKISMSVGYVRNSLKLFKLRPALQEVAKEQSHVKSSLFEVEKVKDPELEEDLLDSIRAGLPFSAIKARVDEYLQHEEVKKQSTKAPDAQTAQRAQANATDGGGNVSRGRQVVGHTAIEINQEIRRGIEEIDWKIDTLESWWEKAAPAKQAALAPKIHALAKRLSALE